MVSKEKIVIQNVSMNEQEMLEELTIKLSALREGNPKAYLELVRELTLLLKEGNQ